MAKVWDGKKVAKGIYMDKDKENPYPSPYPTHYLVNCPDCGAELTIKLSENLEEPDITIVSITHSEHK